MRFHLQLARRDLIFFKFFIPLLFIGNSRYSLAFHSFWGTYFSSSLGLQSFRLEKTLKIIKYQLCCNLGAGLFHVKIFRGASSVIVCFFPTNENNCNHMQAKWFPLRNLCMKDIQKWLVLILMFMLIQTQKPILKKKKIRSREKHILNAWTLFLEYPCIPQSTQCTLYSPAGAECNKHFGEVLDHAGDNAEFTFK